MSYDEYYKKKLDNTPDQRFKKAIDILNDRDFFTDADALFLASTMNHAAGMIIDRLKEKGYPFKLDSAAKFYNDEGLFCAIYNAEKFGDQSAFTKQVLDPYVEEQKKNAKDFEDK